MEHDQVIGEHATGAPAVQIRTARRDWAYPIGLGVFNLGLAFCWVTLVGHWPVVGWIWLAGGCVYIVEALWIRTLGVVLTASTAEVRGIRRHSVPWQDVQAVVHHRQAGAWRVRLLTADGQQLTLRAPTTYWGIGRAQYERDFHQIGQWWLAHRGQSWRPLRPEAPWPT